MYLFYPCRTDAIKRTMTLRFVAFKAIENIRKSSTESGVRNCKPNHDESHRKWNSQVPWTWTVDRDSLSLMADVIKYHEQRENLSHNFYICCAMSESHNLVKATTRMCALQFAIIVIQIVYVPTHSSIQTNTIQLHVHITTANVRNEILCQTFISVFFSVHVTLHSHTHTSFTYQTRSIFMLFQQIG